MGGVPGRVVATKIYELQVSEAPIFSQRQQVEVEVHYDLTNGPKVYRRVDYMFNVVCIVSPSYCLLLLAL